MVDDILFGDAGETITLKEFKRKIKAIGYKYKTHVSGYYTPHRHLEIVDQQGNFVCGSGANVYTSEHIAKHKKAFDLLNKYRHRVFDEEGDKVLF
jgi:hypothetical protein